MSRQVIEAAIPHRPPFLLVDEVVSWDDDRIVCRKRFTGDEDFFRGHYPQQPLVPGVLLCEAAMQAGAVLLSRIASPTAGQAPVATRLNNVKFRRIVRPGDTVDLEVELVERLQDAFFLKARVLCEGQAAVRLEFACTLADVASEGGMTTDFLQLAGKRVLVFGLANRKSVACHAAHTLVEAGAEVVHVVRSEERKSAAEKLFPDSAVYVCDLEREDDLQRLRQDVGQRFDRFDGLVHSVAFADYSGGMRPFHETDRAAFLQSVDVSCYSLMAIARTFADLLDRDASVVTISISTTRMASENYGFMAPVKAALDSAVVFLAKSFSQFSRVRFNAVCPGLLKTSASAGIPGYVDAYLYAEQATLRKQAVKTEEVANVVAFLISPRSSGVNAQRLVIDAGMEVNYFDRDIVSRAMRGE